MERHAQSVASIASTVRSLFARGEPYRVSHGSSNSTRPKHGASGSNNNNNRHQNVVVDISMLSSVLLVDAERRVALVEPNVPMDRLVEATLACGLVPPVVMEFPGITVGGGFSGTSGESSSFRHGFFDETVERVEMVLGDGEVVWASREVRGDLFRGAAGAAGTLGIVTLVELRLVEARKLVKTTYRRVETVREAVEKIRALTEDPEVDYIDGIVFSREHSVIITGELTDTVAAEDGSAPLQTFSNAGDPWFYMHVQDKTGPSVLTDVVVEYIPLAEYLFRYDRAGFWVGRQGYTYFKLIPFTRFFRWLLDDYSHTRTLYHALHAGGIASQFVVQDLALPFDAAGTFIDWVDRELGIWPLWLCPLRGGCSLPTFHPVTAAGAGASPAWKSQSCNEDHDDSKTTANNTESDSKIETRHMNGTCTGTPDNGTKSQPMLNIGVWGWGPREYTAFVAKNRALEKKLSALGGRKWLYAHTYYTEDEFWSEYGHREEYERLREKYKATTLPTVYDKVRTKPIRGVAEGIEGEGDGEGWKKTLSRLWNNGESWLSTWPIGGLYGMVRATLSGDISLHRDAKWRYKGE